MKPGKCRGVIQKPESEEQNFHRFMASCFKSCLVGLGRRPVRLRSGPCRGLLAEATSELGPTAGMERSFEIVCARGNQNHRF